MKLQIKHPNPKAAEDISEGRQMVADAADWLAELDRIIEEAPLTH